VNNQYKGLVLPDQKNFETAYSLALKLVKEKLAWREDIPELCQLSGSQFNNSGGSPAICLRYLNQEYRITVPDFTVTTGDNLGEVDAKDQLLILHYLERARGTKLTHKVIAYQELKEGSVYFPSFLQRTVNPLVEHFGQQPAKLISSASALGGVKVDFGDAAVVIPAFSRVPLTYIVWKGDDEFQSNATVLFDSAICDYLSTEDVIVLCQTVTWKLVRSSCSSRL
jgi:hypothetical protein